MQYMLLIYSSPDAPAVGAPEQADEHAAYFAFTQEVLAAGVMQSGAPLQDADTATTVRVRGGDRLVTDGPFAETKEVLVGYYLIECADLDAAIGWAAKIPTALHGSVEVRPVMMIPGM